ncbi:hypothetical protein WN55_02414, partial [Dufourea novaeangliae]
DWPPTDFFLSGYLKGKVYANKQHTIELLKDDTCQEDQEITQETCENVMKNAVEVARICTVVKGGHLADIIFYPFLDRLNKLLIKKLYICFVLFKKY